jgi:hypothetical protein
MLPSESQQQLDESFTWTAHNERNIFGPPGTGKTDSAGKRLLRAGKQYGWAHVAAVSYTNAGVAALRAEIDKQKLPFLEGNGATLHAFCKRGLEVNDEHTTFDKKGIDAWNEYIRGRGLISWVLSAPRSNSGEYDTPLESPTSGGDLLLSEYSLHRRG